MESDKHPCDWTEDDLEAMDILLLANLKAALKEIITENQFKGVKLHDGEDGMGIAKAVIELRNYLNRLIESLERRFKEDFDNDFVKEIKDGLDLNYMQDMKEKLDNNDVTYEHCMNKIEHEGNRAMLSLMERQSVKLALHQ